ncbi:orotidine-5'-phosphate decarboxylase [Candidatus Gottesmanbacteria bacterium]|nr:orotidine-5'-phosphate decarboxylase [Candidatus Gottesmanbacteria bacterium]
MNFIDKLNNLIEKNNSLVCVGLDSDVDKIPKHLASKSGNFQLEFNKSIIDATRDLVCAYKPNTAFYDQHGVGGLQTLQETIKYIKDNYSDIPIILDAKRGDIGNTNLGYVGYAFNWLEADAITLHPYLGKEAMQPFLDRVDNGIVILCRTSNPGAGEFQDLLVIPSDPPAGGVVEGSHAAKPLYKIVAEKVVNDWNKNGNCLLVVGATYPEELAAIRKIAGDMTFLVPGVGAQGGDVEKTVKAGLNSQKKGLIISSSRGIIFASTNADFAGKARVETRKLRDEINKYR